MCCWREIFCLISGSTQIISFFNKMELRRIVLRKQSSCWRRQHMTLFRQRACIAAGGGHFEHQLWRDIYFVNFSAWLIISFCETSVINLKISVMRLQFSLHCHGFYFLIFTWLCIYTCSWCVVVSCNCLHDFVGNLLTFLTVKEFGKSVKVWWRYSEKENGCPDLWNTVYIH